MCRIDTFELHNRNAHSPAERRPVVMPPFLRVIASMWERSTFLCPPHASTPSKKTQERATNAIVFNIIACGCSFCPKWIAPSSTTSTTTCSAQHGPALASTRSSIYSADVSRFPAFQCCSKRPRTLVVDVCVCVWCPAHQCLARRGAKASQNGHQFRTRRFTGGFLARNEAIFRICTKIGMQLDLCVF